jgi:hypothetical protein
MDCVRERGCHLKARLAEFAAMGFFLFGCVALALTLTGISWHDRRSTRRRGG